MSAEPMTNETTTREQIIRCVHAPTGLILSIVKRFAAEGEGMDATVQIEYATSEGQDVVENHDGEFCVLTPSGEIVVTQISDPE